MLQQLNKLLKTIDTFGVSIPMRYEGETKFKTFYGGLATLIIYSLSLGYAILVFYQWGSNSFLPKITSSSQTVKQGQVQLEEGFLKFGFFNTSVSAFNRSECIILPLLIPIIATQYSQPIPIFEEKGIGLASLTQLQLKLPSINISVATTTKYDGIEFVQYLFVLTPCTEQYSIQYNYTCASQSIIDKFFSNPPPLMELQISFMQFDPKTKGYETVTRPQFIIFETQSTYYTDITFRSQFQSVDSGIIFQSIKEQIHLSNYFQLNQQVSLQASKSILNMTSYAMFLIKMDSLQDQVIVVYPKLSEILAMIGSISATLLMVGTIIKQLNSKLLEDKLFVTLYQGKSLDIINVKRNMLQLIKSIKVNGQCINKAKFKQIKKGYLEQSNLLQMIHDISVLKRMVKFNDSQEYVLTPQSVSNNLLLDMQLSQPQDKYHEDIVLEPDSKNPKIESLVDQQGYIMPSH